ncbi:Uncharacterised protein [Zhongshania aliphaticivorans]|uniref:HTH marR-type domain-containing protein n=1 Tax=Zhongshania aliphaticivorans TaxID=1470434 RepID=A0A5S9N7A3_9GAMM|nr:MarR family transcriptional regulator [Zhongshania aliphaticivorans]CAA0080866.1 Uncharacterised protein [Zhongshania aliphaticivorans]CAA0085438.1 Uncharacterised protein [Zhongshania aliphaticivorans]
MELKPQDTLLALKYWSLNRDGDTASVRDIAEALGISPSEVSKATKRLKASHLVVQRSAGLFVDANALLEWLCYGLRYAYPQEVVGYGRGMPTSWNCPLLNSDLSPPAPAQVWPVSGGSVEGAWVRPIHNAVPIATSKNDRLYKALALVEAIRGGKPRELAIAREMLTQLIKGN